jgi:hypothetical protein
VAAARHGDGGEGGERILGVGRIGRLRLGHRPVYAKSNPTLEAASWHIESVA